MKDLQIYGAEPHDHRFKPSSNFQILISWHNHKMVKRRQNSIMRKRIYFLGKHKKVHKQSSWANIRKRKMKSVAGKHNTYVPFRHL